MPKQDCIIDACSYIYLRQFKFLVKNKEVSPYDLLSKEITVKHHPVISKEIKRNVENIDSAEAQLLSNKEYPIREVEFEKYNKVLYNGTVYNTTNDQGEKANLIVSIDLFLKQKTIPIYLTDDLKAIDREQKLLNTFLLYNIWTSFDVIVFLHLTSNLNFEFAKDAITDLTSFKHNTIYRDLITARDEKIKKNPEKKNEINNEYAKKIKKRKNEIIENKLDYLKRIISINKLKQQ